MIQKSRWKLLNHARGRFPKRFWKHISEKTRVRSSTLDLKDTRKGTKVILSEDTNKANALVEYNSIVIYREPGMILYV